MRKVFVIPFSIIFISIAIAVSSCSSGSSGKSLAGSDSNKNGIRDDIDAWIEKNDGHSKKTHALLQQAARDYQAILVNAGDREKGIAAMRQFLKTQDCSWYVFKGIGNPLLHQLLAEILNTEERSRAWIRANKNMVAVPLEGEPEATKKTCQFDPDLMEN